MKKYNEIVLSAVMGLGLLGMWLQKSLLEKGLDAEGLLIPGCGWGYSLLAATLGFLAFGLFAAFKLEKGGEFSHNFPKCKIRLTLTVAGAGLMLLYGLTQLRAGDTMMGAAAVVACAGMALAAPGRVTGEKPLPLGHILVCVFYILRLIVSFRGWSADPQFQDYVMKMLALVSLMLFALHRANCDAGTVNRRGAAFFGLASLYFSLTALGTGEMIPLMLGSALWAVGAGVNLEPLPAAEEA